MNSVSPSAGRRNLLLIAGILLIATTLRVTFTGAAPLLDAIRSEYGLTTAQTGLLTTLPLLAFGWSRRWRQVSPADSALNVACCWR